MCRRDAIGAYEMQRVHTPNIDRLAASGVRFDSCYTPQALCGPARASIITGLYPHTHGVDRNVYPTKGFFAYDLFHEPIPNPFLDSRFHLSDNFPYLLLNAGYETAQIGKWHLGVGNPGFFNKWKGFNSGLKHWIGKPHESEYRPDIETTEALEFIEQNASRRFFLYMSYYPPHRPIDPPKQYLEYYRDQSHEYVPYHAAVTNLDWNIGRIVSALEQKGVLDRTFIILAADHGTTWAGRPGTSNGYDVSYDDAARVPLIMRYPPLLPQGKVWNSGVCLVDLMPTILEAANVSPVRTHGQSLLGHIRAGADSWTRPIVIENVAGRPIGGALFRERAIRHENWKMILRKFDVGRHTADELYDLQSDPGEKHNLIGLPESRSIIQGLCTMLADWGGQTEDPLAVELAGRTQQG
jgi:arylsulfatase A-like enzyme